MAIPAIPTIQGSKHADYEDDTVPVENYVLQKLAKSNPKFAIISNEAKDVTERECAISLGSLGNAIKLYPKAIGWSILLSTIIAMNGYDIVLKASFYASPTLNVCLRGFLTLGLVQRS